MNGEQESKEQIKHLIKDKTWGQIKKITPKMVVDLVGKDSYNIIKSVLDLELQMDHSQMLLCYAKDIHTTPKCKCGEDVKFDNNKKCFATYCSNKCRFEYYDETLVNRKITNLEKYGHENVLASEYGKNKIVKTNMEKYGVPSYTQTEEYKNSVRGRKNSPESIQKVRDSHRKSFYESMPIRFPDFTPLFPLNEYRGVKGYAQYKWLCKNCNKECISTCDNGMSPVCGHCKPVGSKHELVIRNYLDGRNVTFLYNWRKLPSKKEIDVYIPDKNIGFELCGLYWHSTGCSSYRKNDHINKMEECESVGIRLVTIFDDDMYHKPRIVLNRIKTALGLIKRKIPARKCKVVKVDSKLTKKFLNKYHIQGAIGGSFKYGLEYKGRIVAVMTFNKGRMATGNSNKEGVFELGRYCTVANFSIIGGAGKLFKHFIKTENPDQIFSYSDNRWNSGNVYEKIGMTYVKDTEPNYWYTKDFKSRLHRVNFQKGKLKNMPSYDPDITEEEIMKREKYFRIWDCGSKLFIWNNPNK